MLQFGHLASTCRADQHGHHGDCAQGSFLPLRLVGLNFHWLIARYSSQQLRPTSYANGRPTRRPANGHRIGGKWFA